MNGNRWCTKEDVLKDLAEATGTAMHIDNSFLVVGDKPPPMRVCNTDEDMKLLFGDDFDDAADSKSCDNIDQKPIDVPMSPDLQGITQMIRMVQNFEDDSSEGDSKVCTTRPKMPYDIIKISKLNPNVETFKPRAHLSNPEVNNKNENTKVQDQELNVTENPGTPLPETKKETLQNNNSKISSFQAKKERNVAIANLQKLLSVQPKNENIDTVAQETTKPVKLITPDFYEHPKALSEDVITSAETNNDTKITEISANISSKSSKPSGGYEVIKKLLKSELNVGIGTASDPGVPNSTDNHIKIASPASENKINGSLKSCKEDGIDLGLSDPQIRDSIKKVNNWLNKNNGKHTVASPADIFKPFTFKRKEPRKSPNVTENKISKPSQNTIEQYKPSEYAGELSKMYMERVKKIETHAQQSNWGNLEKILKEKDEKIKQEKLKQQDAEAVSDKQ